MAILLTSLTNQSQTIDSVVLGPFATQVRAASTAEIVAAVAAKTVQADSFDEDTLAPSASDLTLTVGAAPTVSGMSCSVTKFGPFVRLVFTMTAMSMTVTDTGAGGSSASKKLFDFVQGVIVPIGCRQDYTAFAEGAALTGAVGDAAHVLALGSVAADAGDGALTGTEVDFAAATATITNVAGTGAATKLTGTVAPIDGSATASDLYLNWSGTAATIDANSTISVTGTITLLVALLGDD